jgi:hypothetical protein
VTLPAIANAERLRFLRDVAELEARYLAQTDARLFAVPLSVARVQSLPSDQDAAERVDAFVARLGRLQDGLADKLLPALLRWLAEPVGPVIDNLNRAERLGWLTSTDDWLRLRQLRNRMIHEYVKDPAILTDALNAGHAGVPMLQAAAKALCAEVDARLASP